MKKTYTRIIDKKWRNHSKWWDIFDREIDSGIRWLEKPILYKMDSQHSYSHQFGDNDLLIIWRCTNEGSKQLGDNELPEYADTNLIIEFYLPSEDENGAGNKKEGIC